MGGGKRIFNSLLGYLESTIKNLPDARTGNNKVYTIRDAVLSALSTFFIQCPSFLSYQILMEKNKGNNNCRALFGVHSIPGDNQIRNLLNPIDPEYLFPVFLNTFETLKKEKLLDTYRSCFDTYLIAMDGTWFYSSEKISCEQCLHKDHRDGSGTGKNVFIIYTGLEIMFL